MSVTLITQPNTNFVEVHMTGQITRQDYENFLPLINAEITRCGRICLLAVLKDFKGWDLESGWEETKFMFSHFSKIDRIGMVGASEWQKWMAFFCKPFTMSEVKYFTSDQETAARKWVIEAETIYVDPKKKSDAPAEKEQEKQPEYDETIEYEHETEQYDPEKEKLLVDDEKEKCGV